MYAQNGFKYNKSHMSVPHSAASVCVVGNTMKSKSGSAALRKLTQGKKDFE